MEVFAELALDMLHCRHSSTVMPVYAQSAAVAVCKALATRLEALFRRDAISEARKSSLGLGVVYLEGALQPISKQVSRSSQEQGRHRSRGGRCTQNEIRVIQQLHGSHVCEWAGTDLCHNHTHHLARNCSQSCQCPDLRTGTLSCGQYTERTRQHSRQIGRGNVQEADTCPCRSKRHLAQMLEILDARCPTRQTQPHVTEQATEAHQGVALLFEPGGQQPHHCLLG